MQDDQRIIHLWQETLKQAFLTNATDVHIESLEDATLIRFRIDGELRAFRRLKVSHHEHLCAHIKVLASLDIAEKRLPQDGRLCFPIDLNHGESSATPTSFEIDCRISTLPTVYGEKIVVRLLTSNARPLHLDQLGYDPQQLDLVRSALRAPQGLILITGPTGSGKTVTLYTCLNVLNDGTKNISTVEDPPEIRLPGINQVAINEKSGMDFPKALRAMLRQDPDVIMIGEIRDQVTAQMALQAAQTGHLVLASLHTNSAMATITRLLFLGCERDVLAQSLLLITAQRLLRQKCQACANSVKNCTSCQNTRYVGRMAVHEVLPVYCAIQEAIENSSSLTKMLAIAKSLGMKTLLQQAQLLIQQNRTTEIEVASKIGVLH